MKKLTIKDLAIGEGHILDGIVPGEYLTQGGLNFKGPGHRSHDVGCDCKSCDGKGRHVHTDDNEIFVILQGKARLEVDGESHDLKAGDVVICEPGEDHHLVSDEDDPCVNLYLHAGDERRPG
jgi:mannose-6-phosphate isomerase-like protein (cupin superfamily)